MAIRCINYGFRKPFSKTCVFFAGTSENMPNPESESAKNEKILKPDLDKLEQTDKEMVLRTIKALEKVNKLDAKAVDDIRDTIKKIDELEAKAVWITENGVDGIGALLSDLEQKYELSKKDVDAVREKQREASETLAMMESHEVPYAIQYLKNPDGDALDLKNLGSEFKDGNIYTIDFGGDKKAERTIALRQMLPTEVQLVMIKDANGKLLGSASRNSDGNRDFTYYQVEKGYEKLLNKHASVLQGYSIFTEVKAVAEKKVDPEIKAQEESKKEAEEATREMNIKEYEKTGGDMYRAALEFKNNRKAELSRDVKGLSDDVLARDFPYMDHGDEVMAALAKLDSGKQSQDLFRSIRKAKFEPGAISMDEIARTVRGQTAKEVYADFLSLNSDENLKQGEGFKNLENFMSGAHELLDAVSKLRPKDKVGEYKETTKIEGIEQIEKVAGQIFPDSKDQGPREAINFLNWFKLKGNPLTMQTLGKRGLMSNDLQQAASGESAYVQLIASALKPGSEGEMIVDQDMFVTRLNQLRTKGFNNVAMSANKDLIAKCALPGYQDLLKKDLTKERIFSADEGDNLGSVERELIRYGFRKELDENRVKDLFDYKKALEKNAELINGMSPIERKIILEIIKSNPKLTPEDLKDTANIIEKEVVGLAGLAIHRREVQDDRNVTNKPGETITYSADGAMAKSFKLPGGGTGSLGLASSGDLGFAASWEQKVGAGSVVEGGGASIGRSGLNVGTGAEVTIPASEIINGVAEHNVTVGGAAALSISKDPMLALALSFGYKRNLDGTFEKIKQDYEKNGALKEQIEAELAEYKKTLIDKYPPELVEALLARAREFVKQNIGNEAVKDMPSIAITEEKVGFGVGLSKDGVTAGAGIGFKVAFRGQDEIVYCVPHQPNGGVNAELKLREEIAKETAGKGTEIFVAGTLTINPEGGYTTISEAQMRSDELTGKNMELAKQGLQLIPIEVNGEHRLRLRITRVDGNADVFIDRDSQIEAYPGANGDAILNLEEAQKISVRRVDTKNPLRSHGGVLNSEIFISDNINKSNEVIKANSPKMIHLEADIVNGQMTRADVVTRMEGASTMFESEKAALDAKVHINDLYADMQELHRAGDNMKEALNSVKYPVGISEGKRAELDGYAKTIVGENPKFYKQISVEMKADEITKLIKENPNCANLNGAEMTYMHQALMIASLAKAPHDKAFVEHVKEWNRNALERQLNAKNVPDAKNIAKKIMDFYSSKIEASLKTEGSESGLKKTEIPNGAIVQIQVGTQKIEGYRQAFYQPDGAPEIMLAVDLTNPAMLNNVFGDNGVGAKQAEDFVKALTDQLSPLSEKPEELLRSQLGLSVLSASDIIFGANKCKELAAIVRDPKDATSESFKDTYAEFEKLVHELRDNGKVVLPSGLILSVNTTKEMGFYEACRNFTMVMNEKLSITVPPALCVGTEIGTYIEGDRAPNYKEVGFGLIVDLSKVVKPPLPRPQKPEKTPPPPDIEHIPGAAGKDPLGNIDLGKPGHGENQGADVNGGPV